MGAVPSFVGMAVKVTDEPRQKGFCEGEIVTLTGRSAFTDTGYWVLGTGFWIVQGSLDVNVHDTRSPFRGM